MKKLVMTAFLGMISILGACTGTVEPPDVQESRDELPIARDPTGPQLKAPLGADCSVATGTANCCTWGGRAYVCDKRNDNCVEDSAGLCG